MWQYSIELADGTEKDFLTDEPNYPDEYVRYCKEHKADIKYNFCDHYPQTVESWLKGIPYANKYIKINDVWVR